MPQRHPYLCMVVTVGLIVIALTLIVVSALLDLYGHTVPRAWDTALGAVIGALTTMILTVPTGDHSAPITKPGPPRT